MLSADRNANVTKTWNKCRKQVGRRVTRTGPNIAHVAFDCDTKYFKVEVHSTYFEFCFQCAVLYLHISRLSTMVTGWYLTHSGFKCVIHSHRNWKKLGLGKMPLLIKVSAILLRPFSKIRIDKLLAICLRSSTPTTRTAFNATTPPLDPQSWWLNFLDHIIASHRQAGTGSQNEFDGWE